MPQFSYMGVKWSTDGPVIVTAPPWNATICTVRSKKLAEYIVDLHNRRVIGDVIRQVEEDLAPARE